MEKEIKGTVCPIHRGYEIEIQQFECGGSKQCIDLCSSCLNYTGGLPLKVDPKESVNKYSLEEIWNFGAAYGDTCLPEAKAEFEKITKNK